MASTRRNSATPLAASIARVPFATFVSQEISQYTNRINVEELKTRQLPFLVLFGKNDPTCRNIRINDYRSLFGDQVTSESCPGRHCFFVQNPEVVHPKVLEFLQSNSPKADDSEIAIAMER